MNRVEIITGASHGIGAAAAHAFCAYGLRSRARGAQCRRPERRCRKDCKRRWQRAAHTDRCHGCRRGKALSGANGGEVRWPGCSVQQRRRRCCAQAPCRHGSRSVLDSAASEHHGNLLVHALRDSGDAHPAWGAIVNMSSTAGLQGVAGLSPYSTGKHAVIGLTKCGALDYAAENIRVNAIAPGPIGTERISEQQRQQIGQFVPVKRVGTPEEVAQLVVWLCSSEAGSLRAQSSPSTAGA